MLEYLRRLFRYDAWANGEELRAIGPVAAEGEASRAAFGLHGSQTRAHTAESVEGGRATQLMAHVIAAEWLWL